MDLIGMLLIGITTGNLSDSKHNNPEIVEKFYGILQSNFNLEVKESLLISLAIGIVLFLTKGVLQVFINKKLLITLSYIQTKYSDRLFKNFMKAPYDKLVQINSKELSLAILEGSSAKYSNIVIQSIFILSDTILVFVLVIALIIYNTIISFVLIVFFVISIFFSMKYLRGQILKHNIMLLNARISIRQEIDTAKHLIKHIKVNQSERNVDTKIYQDLLKHSKSQALDISIQQVPKILLDATVIFGIAILSVVVGITGEKINMLEFISFYLLSAFRIAPSLLRLQSAILSIVASQPFAEKINEYESYFKFTQDWVSKNSVSQLPRHKFESLKIQNLNYSYTSNPSHKVLSNFNLELSAKEKLMIVGASGTGKTTLLNLILGLLEPNSGDVFINGISASEWISNNPGEIAYLAQENLLFSGSLAENIVYGHRSENVSEERIEEVLNLSKVFDFISKKQPYTQIKVEEGGANFSAGQKQRICLARALMSQPSFLIIDESTNSLDVNLEKSLLNDLFHARPNLTILMISHRPESTYLFDRKIEL